MLDFLVVLECLPLNINLAIIDDVDGVFDRILEVLITLTEVFSHGNYDIVMVFHYMSNVLYMTSSLFVIINHDVK